MAGADLDSGEVLAHRVAQLSKELARMVALDSDARMRIDERLDELEAARRGERHDDGQIRELRSVAARIGTLEQDCAPREEIVGAMRTVGQRLGALENGLEELEARMEKMAVLLIRLSHAIE